MFATLRSSLAARHATRAFSSTRVAAHHVSRVTLVGRLGKEPEMRTTSTDKEYMSYTVATNNYPGPPPGPDGTRPEPSVTWHRVLCFNQNLYPFLQNLKRGSLLFVEANFEVREPPSNAVAGSPEANRRVFLRHEHLRVLAAPRGGGVEKGAEGESSS